MSHDPTISSDGPSVRGPLREARRTWRRLGLPASQRDALAEEFERHLLDARADGRALPDVTGLDVARFAAHWAEQHDALRWPLQALRLTGLFVATLGVIALIVVPFEGTAGYPPAVLLWTPYLALGIALQVLYTARRARMDRTQAVLLHLPIYGGLVIVVALANVLWSGTTGLWVTMPIGVAILLVVAGGALWVVGWLRAQLVGRSSPLRGAR